MTKTQMGKLVERKTGNKLFIYNILAIITAVEANARLMVYHNFCDADNIANRVINYYFSQ